MAKTGKRILAVVLLILTVLLVGCLVFTGNRLADYPEDLDGYKRGIFEGKDDTMVAFTDNGAWYGAGEEEIILLDFVSYEGGEEMSPAWLEDPRDEVSEIVFDITEAEFRKSLTANQLDVYINCMVKGMSQKAYADSKGISPAAVFYACKSIREKAKKYFFADT